MTRPVEAPSPNPYMREVTERLDIVAIGDRLAVLLPDAVAERLGAAAGRSLEANADADGLHIRADRELAGWLAAARRIMDEDAEALAALAR